MSELLEEILSRDNMKLALKRVKANKGAGGVDGIDTNEIDEYLMENWVEIRERIRRRKYKPQAVRRVEIPKPRGTLYREHTVADGYEDCDYWIKNKGE